MGEHRRRPQQNMDTLPEPETAAQLPQETGGEYHPHAAHRRVQAVRQAQDADEQQAKPVMQEPQPQAQETVPARPESAEPEAPDAAAYTPDAFVEDGWASAPQQDKPPERRRVSGHRKHKPGRKMKKSAKAQSNARRLKKGAAEWMLALAMALGTIWGAARRLAAGLAALAAKALGALQGKRLPLRALAVCALSCVALVSAWQVGSIALRSLRTHRLNDDLAQRREELAAEAEQPQTFEIELEDGTKAMVYLGETSPTPAVEETVRPQLTPVPVPDDGDTVRRTAAPNVVATTKYHQVGGDALKEMAALRAENQDLIAWMKIPDVLDLPVVYRDNEYYLTRDFYKQKNAAGTIFLDENHPFKEKTQNLLLHGHNMKDGTMFGRLAQYLYDDSYIRNHPFVYFDTLWRKEQYVIFAVLDVSLNPADGRFFNYFTHSTFSSDAEFKAYIRQLQLKSEYAIPVDVAPGDALLTLSTCLDEDRLVIVARRLREGETRAQLRELIRMTTKQ